MNKVLVIGKSGQLARALAAKAEASEFDFLDRQQLDLHDLEAIKTVLEPLSFNVLINTAAYTAVDLAEDEQQVANTVNHLAVAEIAKVCEKKRAILIHISTDYVFNAKQAIPLKETDEVDPKGIYGLSKLKGEIAISNSNAAHIIIRTSWLYGAEGKNFLKTMIRLGREKDELSVVIDQLGSPTLVNDLAAVLIKIAQLPMEKIKAVSGIYHYSNEGVASWYDFAHAIFSLSDIHVKLTPVSSDKFPTRAKRPAYSLMSKDKIKDTFDLKIHHWRDALEACLSNMNKES